MKSGLYYLHRRKRRRHNTGLHNHRNPLYRSLDRVVLAVGVVAPLMTIPQIWKIFILKDATGISLLAWFLFMVFDLPFIFYGIIHKETPIIITYTLWAIMNGLVLLGAMIYM